MSTDTPGVHEIRVDPETGEVALLLPNGHPVDPAPWFVIQPRLVCELTGEGSTWVEDHHVVGWLVVKP